MQQLDALMSVEPAEPRGWFRWLHHHYLFRHGHNHEFALFGNLYNDAWQGISDTPTPLYKRQDDVFMLEAVLNRHAWMAGMVPLVTSVFACWHNLERPARGAFLAGLSERLGFDDVMDSAMTHLHEADFSPESLCQLVCNYVKYGRIDLFETLLSSSVELTAEIRRFDAFQTAVFNEDEILAQLSHRVIDLILEAALIRNHPEAASLALKYGADPNIPIWQLERSSNHHYSALGYVMREGYSDLVELLLKSGASEDHIGKK